MKMEKLYTPDDYVSVTELKQLPVGSTITGQDTYMYAIKNGADEWTFDDRIDKFFETTSYFIANVFNDTTFVIKEGVV